MLPYEGRCGTEQARLRVGDKFDGDRGHQFPETPLGLEPFGKARSEQRFPDPVTEPPGDYDAAETTLGKRNVARDAAERHAEAIHSRCGKTVTAILSARPDDNVVFLGDRLALYRGKRNNYL